MIEFHEPVLVHLLTLSVSIAIRDDTLCGRYLTHLRYHPKSLESDLTETRGLIFIGLWQRFCRQTVHSLSETQ